MLFLDVVKVPGWDLGVAGREQLPIPWVGGGISRKPALAGTFGIVPSITLSWGPARVLPCLKVSVASTPGLELETEVVGRREGQGSKGRPSG